MINESVNFSCTSCGQCCSNIEKSIDNLKEVFNNYNIPLDEIDYNYQWDSTGKCEKLNDDHSCSVYETRPNVCNLDWLQKKLDLNKNLFYSKIKIACNKLITEAGLEEKYKVK